MFFTGQNKSIKINQAEGYGPVSAGAGLSV
jgi:hypothetical protein